MTTQPSAPVSAPVAGPGAPAPHDPAAPAVPGPVEARAGSASAMSPERRELIYLSQTRRASFTARQERRYAKKMSALNHH